MPQIQSKYRLITGLLVIASFGFGVVVGKFQLFPHRMLNYTFDVVASSVGMKNSESGFRRITTSHVVLDMQTYDGPKDSELNGFGGGFSYVGNSLVGVDGAGQFFTYEGGGQINYLEIDVPTNREAFLQYLKEQRLRSDLDWSYRKAFRVLDFLAVEQSSNTTLYISYDHWDDLLLGRTSRIARRTLSSEETDALANLFLRIRSDEWEVIHETSPLITFADDEGASFAGYHSGGGLLITENGSILFAAGDYNLDGVQHPDATQDNSLSAGKIVEINLESLNVTEYARGFRNPGGLIRSAAGQIWVTDFGPEGGDELLNLKIGKHYGWPFETHGTDYGSLEWPLVGSAPDSIELEPAVFSWVPSIAPSDIIQIQDWPREWSGDLLISTLVAGSLFRIRLDDSRVEFVEPISIGRRIRTLIQRQDGSILLFLEEGDFAELRATVD
ncbi:MAG: PQQ-dependent sugar dehydrogenase [Bacteroidetes bacterium]|nr:PQQ-dependent sugar dehydrogenase [Bacteroidota bacterium]